MPLFAEKKTAVWVYEKQDYNDSRPDMCLYTADTVTLQDGFIKLEGNIRLCDSRRDFSIKRVLESSKDFLSKAEPIGTGVLYLSPSIVYAMYDFEQ